MTVYDGEKIRVILHKWKYIKQLNTNMTEMQKMTPSKCYTFSKPILLAH